MASNDIATLVADPGFTPGIRRLGELLDLVVGGDETLVKHAERAVLRIETQYAERVSTETVARARSASRPARARLTHLVGRLAQEKRDPAGGALAWLMEALADGDPKTRRAAARGLGKLPTTKTIETALATAFDGAENDDDKRAFAAALGKTGGESARSRLEGSEHGRAALIASRELARKAPSAIDTARAPGEPVRIRFHTRSGLESILEEEIGSRFGKARLASPGVVEVELKGPLSEALSVRTATHVGFALAAVERSEDLAADITRVVSSNEALAVFRTFTTRSGTDVPIRFRIVFARGGHRRAIVWRTAELVQAARRELLNDPTESTWEVIVDEVGSKLFLELVPRAYRDERFAYRQDMVAASSHPTIAAALALVAPRRDDDVVWDPFTGAGAELVERARLGKYSRLVGTDVDARAIAAARANLRRAGVEDAALSTADACAFSPEGVTLIVTNPPMGRRVHRGTHADLLERFVTRAADVLVPGGALVWIVPEPRAIRARAEAVGLVLARANSVDMGGFSAELSVYQKKR